MDDFNHLMPQNSGSIFAAPIILARCNNCFFFHCLFVRRCSVLIIFVWAYFSFVMSLSSHTNACAVVFSGKFGVLARIFSKSVGNSMHVLLVYQRKC